MVIPVIRSTIIYLFSSIPFQILNFAGSVFLARLLAPEHFGLVTLALVTREWISFLAGWSTSQYFILGSGTQEEFEDSLTAALLAGLLISIIGIGIYLLSESFGSQRFYLILMIVCASEGIVFMAQSLLAPMERNLEFFRLSMVRNGCSSLSLVLAILLAMTSPTIWPLVIREFSLSLIMLIAGLWFCDYRLKININKFRKTGFKLIKYGYSLNFSRAAEILFYRMPDVIIAKLFGVSQTGQFTQARTFLMIVLKLPNTVLEQVLFTSLVKLKTENKSDEYFYLVEVFTSRFMLMCSWLFALLGPIIFIWLFGDKWLTASLLLPHLSAFIFFAALFNALQVYFYSLKNQILVTLSYSVGVLSFISFVLLTLSSPEIVEIAAALSWSMGVSCATLHIFGFIRGYKIPIVRVFWLPILSVVAFWWFNLSINLNDQNFIIFLIILFIISFFEVLLLSKKVLKALI